MPRLRLLAPLLAALAAAHSAGCGARTSLDEGDPSGTDAGPFDAGRRLDGGRLDAGSPRDAGPPPEGCQLGIVAGPAIVFDGMVGGFHSPQVVVRDDRLDMLAIWRDDPSRETGTVFASSISLALDDPRSLGALPETNQIAAELAFEPGGTRTLAVCSAARDQLLFSVLRRGTFDVLGAFGATRCFGLATTLEVALAAFESPGDRTPVWAIFNDSSPITMPTPTDPAAMVPGHVAVTSIEGLGFAYASTSPTQRSAAVEVLEVIGLPRASWRIENVPGRESAPALASWAFAPEQLALAFWGPAGLEVAVIDFDAGELGRTTLPAFSMAGDISPVTAPIPGAQIVGGLAYGDFDPTGGDLYVAALGPDGAPMSELLLPTRRTDDIQTGGIDIATRGRQIILHWTEAEVEMGFARPVTKAVVLDCVAGG